VASTVRRVAVGLALLALAIWADEGAARAGACPAGRATGATGDALRVGITESPPFVVTSASERAVGGSAIELLRSIAAEEGWRLTLIELSAQTLRARLAACELDLGVDGVAESAQLAEALDLSQPYLSTVTTVIVKADDPARAARSGTSAGGVARGVLRGLVYGLGALGALAVASWLLNAFSGFPGGPPLRWRRIDAAVSGPWAGLRWLWRSTTGRVLVAGWLGAGVAIGVTGALGAAPVLALGRDPLRVLVERAAHNEVLLGERYPDGAEVSCAKSEARDCFHGFADGTLSAIAGPREVLCHRATELSLDRAVLRDDLAIPEQFAYLLPPGSPLRSRLDIALLRRHERSHPDNPSAGPCPGESGGRR
jgi:ABC-type amino acid transport substrate-binding protein